MDTKFLDKFSDKVYRPPGALNGKFFLQAYRLITVRVLIDTNIIFLIDLDNNLLSNILSDDISFNRELGINKVSDNNFNRDLDNNNGLYNRRISIVNK